MLINIKDNNKDNVTMTQLAKKIGMTREYLQSIKNGSKGQSLENLYKIAIALNCYPSQLLPKSWQEPIIKATDKISLIEQAILIYEKLKKEEPKLSAQDLAKIIAVIIDNNGSDIGKSEIERMFTVLSLKC